MPLSKMVSLYGIYGITDVLLWHYKTTLPQEFSVLRDTPWSCIYLQDIFSKTFESWSAKSCSIDRLFPTTPSFFIIHFTLHFRLVVHECL